VLVAIAGQLGVHRRWAVAALRLGMHGPDSRGQHRVGALAGRRPGPVGIVGGSRDLKQLTRALDAVLLRSLRLDERVHAHRVSFAKKAVAR
jgi:hypothetical protein